VGEVNGKGVGGETDTGQEGRDELGVRRGGCSPSKRRERPGTGSKKGVRRVMRESPGYALGKAGQKREEGRSCSRVGVGGGAVGLV